MTIEELAHEYYVRRGINPQGRPKGFKLLEEVGELIERIAEHKHKPDEKRLGKIYEEIGDVGVALAYIAEWFGTTVEDSMKYKTIKDDGRNKVPVDA